MSGHEEDDPSSEEYTDSEADETDEYSSEEGEEDSDEEELDDYHLSVTITLHPPPTPAWELSDSVSEDELRDNPPMRKRTSDEDGQEAPVKTMKVELEPEPQGDDAFPLQFRLPTGVSIRRNFRQSSTLQDLVRFVSTHPETPSSFDLLRRPSQVILVGGDEIGKTLEEVGVTGSEVLFVRKID